MRATNPKFWPYAEARLSAATCGLPPAELPIPKALPPNPTTTALPEGTLMEYTPAEALTVSNSAGDHVPSAATAAPPKRKPVVESSAGVVRLSASALV